MQNKRWKLYYNETNFVKEKGYVKKGKEVPFGYFLSMTYVLHKLKFIFKDV